MDLRKTFYRTGIVIATIAGAYIIYRLADLVVILFLSIIFASTVRPLKDAMERVRIPSSVAIALIYFVTILAILTLIIVAIPPVVQLAMDMFQENQLASDVNVALIRTTFLLRQQFKVYVPILSLPPQLQELLDSADETITEQAIPFAQVATAVVGKILLAIVLSIYWLVARSTALRQLLRLTSQHYRKTVYQIWMDTEDTLGAYLRGQFLLACIIGTVSYIGLITLQVPNARALAVLAGLFEVIPFIGPVLAAIPAILVGLTVSPITALLVLLLYVLVQSIEGNFLIPHIMGRGLRLHPMIVLLAITAGFYLNGIVGAVLALPLASAVQITVRHLRTMSPEDEPDVVEAAVVSSITQPNPPDKPAPSPSAAGTSAATRTAPD
jgi:predicted PurR-regulated permease PerM